MICYNIYMIQINTDKKLLKKYSIDASIFTMTPSGVYTPKYPKDIEQIVQDIDHFNKSIIKINQTDSSFVMKKTLTARAAGTCMSGGPLTENLLISFTEHMKYHGEIIKEKILNTDKFFIEVEPGLYHRDLEKYINKQGLMFPSYPASKDICAMGGIINNNSGGEKTLKYGKTDKYIKEMEMICADGHRYSFYEQSGDNLDTLLDQNNNNYYAKIHREIYFLLKNNWHIIEKNKPTVSKNSAGYYLWNVYNPEKRSLNLVNLFCGAQGTLGIMSKAKIELVPISIHSRMITFYLKDIKDIAVLTQELKKYSPESLELYDDHTFKIAMKYLPSLIYKMFETNKSKVNKSGDTNNSIWNLLKLGFSFWKEVKMIIVGGIPKIIIIAEFTSNDKVKLEADMQDIFYNINNFIKINNIKAEASLAKSEEEAQKYWTFRRESFNLLRSKLKDLRTVPFIEDVVVHADDFPSFMPKFENILDKYNLIYTIAGHAGDGNLHVIPLMKLKDDHSIQTIKSLSDEVYTLVGQYRGSVTGEHNDGLIHAPFLHYMYDIEMLDLFQKVKDILDPSNIFNPNKKIGVTWDYAKKYIDRSV